MIPLDSVVCRVGIAHQEVESMKGLYAALLVACLLVSAAAVSAATLTNNDGQSYVVEANVDGQIYELTVLDGATISLCDYGCEVRLVKTGQTITVQPDDSVVIDDGVMSLSQ
jgi:hypothetical protein